MNRTGLFSKSTLTLTMCTALLVGCGGGGEEAENGGGNGEPAGAVDPHDVPMTDAEIAALKEKVSTWDAAIDEVKSLRDKIRDGATSGKPAEAHRPLDELDLVLEWLPEIAQKEVPKEQWETVTTTSESLRDKFNAVHANIDEGEEPDYESVAGEIDQGVETLTAIETE